MEELACSTLVTCLIGVVSSQPLLAGIDDLLAIEEAVLANPDAAPGEAFGRVLDISGDIAAVGVSQNEDGRGAVCVFRRLGDAWDFEEKLVPHSAEPGDFFGTSLDIDGERIAVGASGDDDFAIDGGAVYVFERGVSGWEETNKLTALDGEDGDHFGHAVGMQGEHLVVGAPFEDSQGVDEGAVYFFLQTPSGWALTTIVKGFAFGIRGRLGSAVAVDGNLAAASAPYYSTDDFTQSDDGRIMAFRWDGSLWLWSGVLPGFSPGWAAGQTWTLQALYRDPVSSPCGSERNTTAAIQLTFLP